MDERYCTIEQSIIESCKQIRLMREGKMQKPTLDDLWQLIQKWEKDDGTLQRNAN